MDLMEEEWKAQVSELNPYLLCSLCSGYMIDASTIVECLHSFCRSCIYKYLESSKYCPICDVQIHKTKPYLNIKADKTLQTLIYKLVPNLLKNELQRRQDFFDKHPDTDVSSLSIMLPTEHHHIIDHYKFLRSLRDQSSWISLCARPITCFQRALSSESLESCFEEASMVRYFFCPPDVKIFHLKKLLREKFELDESVQVEMYHTERPLADFSTLSKVTEIYDWDKKNPFELDYSIKIPPENSSAKAENDTSKLQASKAFKARLQARMREIQLKSKYLKPNKRKLRALQAGTHSESTAELKIKKMRLGFGKRPKVISDKSSSLLTQTVLGDNPKPSSPSEPAFPSRPSSPPTLSSGLTPSSEFTCPLHSNASSVLVPNVSQSSLPNESLPSPVDLASNPLSLPSYSQLRTLSCPIQSLSGSSLSRKSSEDCIITEVYVPHKKNPSTPESKKNRNIFDLVRPLLKSSVFNKPERPNSMAPPEGTLVPSTSKSSLIGSCLFINSTAKLVSSVASAISKEIYLLGNNVSTPINILSSSSSDSSLICNSDVLAVVDHNASKEGVAIPSTPSKETGCRISTRPAVQPDEGTECGETGVKNACRVDNVKAVSRSICSENHLRKSIIDTARYSANDCQQIGEPTAASGDLEISRSVVDGPKFICHKDDSSVPGDPSPASSTVDSDSKLPKKTNSSCNIEGRSTFFEKFSKDLEFDIEDIGTTNPKVFNTDSNHFTHLNKNITAEIHESNIKSLNKISNPETLNLHCQDSEDRRPTKRVKPTGQGKKVGFEASCTESQGSTLPLGNTSLVEDGEDDSESNVLETDELLSKTAASRSYKISKREMCGLVMDMSKKYLKEFPANGFAFASTLSDEAYPHQCPGHQRRSKQKSISS